MAGSLASLCSSNWHCWGCGCSVGWLVVGVAWRGWNRCAGEHEGMAAWVVVSARSVTDCLAAFKPMHAAVLALRSGGTFTAWQQRLSLHITAYRTCCAFPQSGFPPLAGLKGCSPDVKGHAVGVLNTCGFGSVWFWKRVAVWCGFEESPEDRSVVAVVVRAPTALTAGRLLSASASHASRGSTTGAA